MNIVLSLTSLSFFNFIRKNRNSRLFLGDDFVKIENGAGHGGPGSVPGQVERLVTPGFAELQQLPGARGIGAEFLKLTVV